MVFDYTEGMTKTCSIQGCDGALVARGWCRRHYNAWHRNGDPENIRGYRAPVADRLKAHLMEMPSGCWEFRGGGDGHGYGLLRISRHKMDRAHRVAYREWVGPIPAGMFVCHRCDNPPCCNPEHLFVGTQGDNMADMQAKGRGVRPAQRPDHGELIRAGQARARVRLMKESGAREGDKYCGRCDTWQAIDNFGPNAAQRDGRQSYCRPCLSEYRKSRTA